MNWGVALNEDSIKWVNNCVGLDHQTKQHVCNPFGDKKYDNNIDGNIGNNEHLKESQGEDIKDNWSEWKRMLSNMGWSGVPDDYEGVESELDEILEKILKDNIKPSSIRSKKDFFDKLDKDCYNKHKQYIDAHC
mmetsp:Transcript_55705/g.50137  ORF Transcript_55705/g.50137 Transcript_55705/m.50137 type:complete len:134 (+) Transcript_55705:3-404(+)